MQEGITGLSQNEAKNRLGAYGRNILPEKSPPSSIIIFISQFRNPLVYVLLVAGMVTLFLGDYPDTGIIFFVVIVNSFLGFFQEQRASQALQSLKSLIHPKADVIREGRELRIDIENVVPGDVVEIEQGDKIPADGRLIYANRLLISEAVLTGESFPVEKNQKDLVYMGTVVSSGVGYFEVINTGSRTEMGKIAISVQKPQEDTPLTKQLKIFSNQLTLIVIILTLFVFVIGLFTGKEFVEIFKTSVALAVSAIPEGLLVALTAVLAIGMQRILKRKGLVRSLVCAETLGGVTTICVDKTGTLTQGKLEVTEEYGDIESVCLQHFASSEDPIMIASRDWLEKHSMHYQSIGKKFRNECKLIDSIPFTPQNRYYATLIEHKDRNKEAYINGAPEILLKWSDLGKSEIKRVKERIKLLTKQGKRVIGMAKKDVDDNILKLDESELTFGLKWVGLLVFADPLRSGVKDSFELTRQAGIRTIVITGDYADTASAVIENLGMVITKSRTMVGYQIEKMSEKQLSEKLKKMYREGDGVILFARTKPEQKLRVISALKANGEVVAMMGDGVNDAPALHKADIGIVVGDATDVAKESADLVLLDSSFETIIDAVREGRGIFDNIRKVILYLLSDSFEEIITVCGALIFALPLPITAVQVLWINIVSDGFPHLSLTVDPKRTGIMKEKPRSSKEVLVSSWMKRLIFTVSIFGGLIAFSLYIYYFRLTDDLQLARSIAFATLGINSLVYVFSIRTLRRPFWVENPFDNKWLNIAVMLGLIFQFFPFSTQGTRSFFGLSSLTIVHWFIVFVSSMVMFIMIEITKYIFHFSKKV